MANSSHEVSQLLAAWGQGDVAARDRLVPLVYDELRRLARNYMRRERDSHTLQASALVNEAYLRLADQNVPWQNRAHFFGIAARLMRQILVDHARRRGFDKRGGGALKVSLTAAAEVAHDQAAEVIALDDALNALAEFDERKCRVVELRFFGGLSVEESAEVLGVAPVTVMRDWRLARAWLRVEMNRKAELDEEED